MRIEEMTDEQINDYLRKFEYQHYKQLEVCTKENKKLKNLEINISKLKAEKGNRNCKQMKIGEK